MYIEIFLNLENIRNSKHFWSQAFRLRDARPVLMEWRQSEVNSLVFNKLYKIITEKKKGGIEGKKLRIPLAILY